VGRKPGFNDDFHLEYEKGGLIFSQKGMYQLTEREEWLCRQIVDSAFKVHYQLGPGLLERVYEACFCRELEKRGMHYLRQVELPICYDDMIFDECLRLDVLVEDCIVCEMKAVELLNPVWAAQVRSHLKLMQKHVGFVINFNVEKIKDGLRRICVE
jgi:GxxExxY protein